MTMLVPCLPEMNDIVDYHYADAKEVDKAALCDFSAGVFNSGIGIGSLIGPLFGSIVSQQLSFQSCCDFVALFDFIFAMLYIICTWRQRSREPISTKDYEGIKLN